MKTRITESTLLFISIVKWVFLATVAGAVVGFATTIFLKLLNISTAAAGAWEYSYLFLPLALFASALLVKYLAPDAKGHGTEKVIEAVHKKAAKIPLAVVPVKLVATIITLALGGSAGKEGPCAQIGAGLTSALSVLFNFNEHDRKKMVICGISAGFAAVFGTPIAGAIFGVEVLFIGAILYEVLLPSFIAGITAYQVSAALEIAYFHKPVNFVPVFSETFMLKVMFAGIFFGLASLILIELLKYGERVAERIKLWAPLKGLAGGAALVLLALLFSKKYLGLGLGTIEAVLGGAPAAWYDFLLKSVFTSITLSFGGSGGIITPIFFIGTTTGSLYAQLMHLNSATFAAIGFVAVLAGAANTPIAASIMAVELFGPVIAPYATVACVISFLMTGHKSVYPSQVLSIRKTDSIQVEIGKELEDIKTSGYSPKPKSAAALALRVIQKVDDLVNRRD
ncbi:MAG TPA: chloride channel protein [Elusimicrobiales bacterium]|nr:chloride channel protein [Elusimicrobiales bacterium]